MQLALQISNLKKIYHGSEEPALKDLSFSVEKGEIFGLLGPNGAGKTTTISILTGLIPNNSGTVMIDGLEIPAQINELKLKMGVVPQEIALYPTLTALENLRIFGMIYRMNGKLLRNRIEYYLRLMGLSNAADKQVNTFSGGMKRRLNLIAGLIHHPVILFLDEPTAGIDVHSRNVILDYIRELGKQGISIVYTSHYLEEAESICSRVVIIDKGRKIAEGKPENLITNNPGTTTLQDIFLKLTGKELRD